MPATTNAVPPSGPSTFLRAGSPSKTDADAASSRPLDQKPAPWHGWPADAPAAAIAPFDEEQARKHQQAWADYLKLPLEFTNTIGMKFILIPPGEFLMGSTPEEIEEGIQLTDPNDKNWHEIIKTEAPQHKVVLTRPFYLSVHEVTQKEYEAVTGMNPSYFSKTGPNEKVAQQLTDLGTENFPVDNVSWNDAAEYCAKLSKQEQLKPFYSRAGETIIPLKGTGYRLPTEAEWEFACRAGTTTKFWNGDESPAGWFSNNSGGRTHEIGELGDNPFGLYDVHGNVYEWVEDPWEPRYYERFAKKIAIDPKYPFSAGPHRVARGGVWINSACHCRSAFRYRFDPTQRSDLRFHPEPGFRVALATEALRRELPAAKSSAAAATSTNSNAP
jgi:formylglycine-generating enzyme required for sulfatase activity